VLRRAILGCLLLAGVISLVSMNAMVGAVVGICAVASPALVAAILNREPIRGDWPDDKIV
jgi:hypothetical protein